MDPNYKTGVMDDSLFKRLIDECVREAFNIEAIRFGNIAESMLDIGFEWTLHAVKAGLPVYIESNMMQFYDRHINALDNAGWRGRLLAHVQPGMGKSGDYQNQRAHYDQAKARWGDRVELTVIDPPRRWAGDGSILMRRAVRCSANRPNESMIVCYDGRVQLCCQDVRQRVIVGDVSHLSIREVWNGRGFAEALECLASGMMPLCDRCEWGEE